MQRLIMLIIHHHEQMIALIWSGYDITVRLMWSGSLQPIAIVAADFIKPVRGRRIPSALSQTRLLMISSGFRNGFKLKPLRKKTWTVPEGNQKEVDITVGFASL
jgi:hypothetical protein